MAKGTGECLEEAFKATDALENFALLLEPGELTAKECEIIGKAQKVILDYLTKKVEGIRREFRGMKEGYNGR